MANADDEIESESKLNILIETGLRGRPHVIHMGYDGNGGAAMSGGDVDRP